MYIGVLSVDNSNNGNICTASCPTDKGFINFFFKNLKINKSKKI